MRKLIITVLAGALGLSMIAGVSAQMELDPDEAGIVVQENSSGTVSPVITKAPDFGTVNYSVIDQEGITNPVDGADNLIIEVTDDRGGNEGWEVTISGTAFTGSETSNVFEVSNLTLGTGSVDAQYGDSENVDAAAGHEMSESLEPILTANPDVGSNGIFTVTYTGNTLTVPGGTPVDQYVSTLTVQVPAAP